MKKCALLFAFLLLGLPILSACDPYGLGQPGGPTGSFVPTFEDNFDTSAGGLNTSKWNYGWFEPAGQTISGPVGVDEEACYGRSQVQFGYDVMILRGTNPAGTVHCPKNSSDTNPDREYLSGAVESFGKFQQSYGYFEARVQFDCSGGQIANWPAWWAVAPGEGPDGEFDFVEGLNGSAASHWHPPNALLGSYGAKCDGWHIYAGEWKPGQVIAYLDGVVQGQYTSGTDIGGASQGLVLGNQYSAYAGHYGGPVKDESFMNVDYVRVWRR